MSVSAGRDDAIRIANPANILLTKPGDGDQRILLGDFGIAHNTCDTCGLTATNMTIGTFPYPAPEQLTDEPMTGAPISTRRRPPPTIC